MICIIKPQNRTVVICEAVTWTEGIALGLIAVKAISANLHFRDRKDEGSRTLDIGKQEVPKSEIPKRRLNRRHDISNFGKLRDKEPTKASLFLELRKSVRTLTFRRLVTLNRD